MSVEANNGAAPGAPQDPKPVDPQKSFVTLDQFDAITRQINGLSAALRKIADAKAPEPKLQDPQNGPEPAAEPRKSQADKAIEAQMLALKADVESVKQREERLKMRATKQLTREACSKLGVTAHAMEPLISFMQAKYGGRIMLDEDTESIFIKPVPEREQIDAPKTLEEVIGAYLKSPEGGWALPARQLPAAGSTETRTFTQNGKHIFSDMTVEEILNHPDKVAFGDYIKNYGVEWAQKKMRATTQKR